MKRSEVTFILYRRYWRRLRTVQTHFSDLYTNTGSWAVVARLLLYWTSCSGCSKTAAEKYSHRKREGCRGSRQSLRAVWTSHCYVRWAPKQICSVWDCTGPEGFYKQPRGNARPANSVRQIMAVGWTHARRVQAILSSWGLPVQENVNLSGKISVVKSTACREEDVEICVQELSVLCQLAEDLLDERLNERTPLGSPLNAGILRNVKEKRKWDRPEDLYINPSSQRCKHRRWWTIGGSWSMNNTCPYSDQARPFVNHDSHQTDSFSREGTGIFVCRSVGQHYVPSRVCGTQRSPPCI